VNSQPSNNKGISLSYAHMHHPVFVPGLGNLKKQFEVGGPGSTAAERVQAMYLLPSGLIEVTASKGGKSFTFLTAHTNFDVLVPQV
jgi:hypothetical protein